MRKIFQKIMLLCFMVSGSLAAFSQNVVTGKVTDSRDGSAVVGANITVKGTRTAAQTGSDGSFRITAPADATLVEGVGITLSHTENSLVLPDGSVAVAVIT